MSVLSRLLTQMYSAGDPLFARDPIVQSIRDEFGRRDEPNRRTRVIPP